MKLFTFRVLDENPWKDLPVQKWSAFFDYEDSRCIATRVSVLQFGDARLMTWPVGWSWVGCAYYEDCRRGIKRCP